jgi:hypothetical protein
MKRKKYFFRLIFSTIFILLIFSNISFGQDLIKNYQMQKLERLNLTYDILLDSTIQVKNNYAKSSHNPLIVKIMVKYWKLYQSNKRLSPPEQKKAIKLRYFFKQPQKIVGATIGYTSTSKKKDKK